MRVRPACWLMLLALCLAPGPLAARGANTCSLLANKISYDLVAKPLGLPAKSDLTFGLECMRNLLLGPVGEPVAITDTLYRIVRLPPSASPRGYSFGLQQGRRRPLACHLQRDALGNFRFLPGMREPDRLRCRTAVGVIAALFVN